MPKLKHRIIYDDDGVPMKEGSKVLVNSTHEAIIHFDSDGEITISGWHWEDVETVEQMPDDRFEEIEDPIISDSIRG